MKPYMGSRGIPPLILNPALYGGERLKLCPPPHRFTPGKKWIRSWVGPTVAQNGFEETSRALAGILTLDRPGLWFQKWFPTVRGSLGMRDHLPRDPWIISLMQCFSNFVRPRPGKFVFYKTRARSQKIVGLQAIFMTGHKQRYSISRILKDFDVWKFPITHEYFHV
jgi:hypothetical protein